MAAAHDADVIVQELKLELRDGGSFSAAVLTALGDWIDRVGRLSKIVIDARINERQVELEEGQAALIVDAFHAAVEAIARNLSPGDRDLLIRTFLHGLGRAPDPGVGWEPTVVRGEIE